MLIKRLISVYTLIVLSLINSQTSAMEAPSDENDKSHILYSAIKLEERIKNRGGILVEKNLTDYLESILEKMFPKIYGKLRVKVYTSTIPNAFILANGSVYVSIGLLARLENEAQIAAILSHETAHYVGEHFLSKRAQLQEIAYDSAFLKKNILLEELSEFSIETELEADRFGYFQLFSSGYDTEETISVMKIIEKHSPSQSDKKRQSLETHPPIQVRVQQLRDLMNDENNTNQSFLGELEYLKNITPAVQKYLQLEIEKYHFDEAIDLIKAKSHVLNNSPVIQYYVGEAYRQRNGEGDDQRAKTAYSQAINLDPGYALPYYKLGILNLKQKELDKARENFNQFLKIGPDELEATYVNYYLEKAMASGVQ